MRAASTGGIMPAPRRAGPLALALLVALPFAHDRHARAQTAAPIGSDEPFRPSSPDLPPEPGVDLPADEADAATPALGTEQAAETESEEETAASDPVPAPVETRGRLRPQIPAQRVGTLREDGTTTPLANEPAGPVQGGAADSDLGPYDPIGLRLGSLTLLPSITQTVGSSSNANASQDGVGSAFTQTDVSLGIVSDWSRNELRGGLNGSYQAFFADEADDLPQLDADLALRIDISREWAATVGGTYDLRTESATSDNLDVPPGVLLDDRPIVQRGSVFVEGERRGGRLTASLRGTLERDVFDDATLSNGTTVLQEDRNFTRASATARLGYETSPALQPFVEGTAGTRIYDLDLDSNGNDRSGEDYDLRAGVALDLGPKLSGTASAGVLVRTYDDARLDTVVTPALSAALDWSPDALTTVSLTADTALAGSADADESASRLFSGALRLSRDVRDNLTLDTLGGLSVQDFDDGRTDALWRLEAGALWRLNRAAALTARVAYENQTSNDPTVEFDALSGRVGLRLQR